MGVYGPIILAILVSTALWGFRCLVNRRAKAATALLETVEVVEQFVIRNGIRVRADLLDKPEPNFREELTRLVDSQGDLDAFLERWAGKLPPKIAKKPKPTWKADPGRKDVGVALVQGETPQPLTIGKHTMMLPPGRHEIIFDHLTQEYRVLSGDREVRIPMQEIIYGRWPTFADNLRREKERIRNEEYRPAPPMVISRAQAAALERWDNPLYPGSPGRVMIYDDARQGILLTETFGEEHSRCRGNWVTLYNPFEVETTFRIDLVPGKSYYQKMKPRSRYALRKDLVLV